MTNSIQLSKNPVKERNYCALAHSIVLGQACVQADYDGVITNALKLLKIK